jgi:hypothetical protein
MTDKELDQRVGILLEQTNNVPAQKLIIKDAIFQIGMGLKLWRVE